MVGTDFPIMYFGKDIAVGCSVYIIPRKTIPDFKGWFLLENSLNII